jgi:hypothetical protein
VAYIPSKGCICGCYGRSYKNCWSQIDVTKYKICPARKRRKSSLSKKKINTKIRTKAKIEAKKQLAITLKKQLLQAEEEKRIKNDLPALSKEEALRRNLSMFIGKPCKQGHAGERLTRNSYCVLCKKLEADLRDARKRGGEDIELSNDEKQKITIIYNEARRISKLENEQYHVDHIMPLSAGGAHHPNNLQILKASINLSKGARWDKKSKLVKGIRFEDIEPENRNTATLYGKKVQPLFPDKVQVQTNIITGFFRKIFR